MDNECPLDEFGCSKNMFYPWELLSSLTEYGYSLILNNQNLVLNHFAFVTLSNMFWVGLVVFTFNFKNMSNSWDWLNRTIYACTDCPYILQMFQSSTRPETYSGKQINLSNIRLINVYMTIFFSTSVILNFKKSTTFTVKILTLWLKLAS